MAERDVLPSDVVPVHYDLSVFDLNTVDFTFHGLVKIHLRVQKSTNKIALNAKELKIKPEDGLVTVGEETATVEHIDRDEKINVYTFTLSKSLPEGSTVIFSLQYAGSMNDSMAGFYRSQYKNQQGETEWMFQTQFEACDARRAFPCFDEPNLKATFTVDITAPSKYTVLSNMPVTSQEPVGDNLTKFTFERSPKMSTYLLAWSVGNFEYVEDFTEKDYAGKKLPVRVYTTVGLKEQARMALYHAKKIVDYYSEVFEIDYPLPKLDLIAIHDFASNAMENWGLVTFRTTALLFDEKTSDAAYKPRVVYVIAHELAHQWFGNLVTMDWWSELWLNEGFATWMGWFAVDYLYPEWDVWGQFVTEQFQAALRLDSLRMSHPIEVPVRSALEIDQIFDEISYLKGCSVIRMLTGRLGTKTFLKGIASYLKQHSFANATTEDLWIALGRAADLDVSGIMDTWIRKIGYPVITIAEELDQISIEQSRFLLAGDVKPEEDQTHWWVPLLLNEKSWRPQSEKITELTTKEATLRHIDTSSYVLNTGRTGFYRVNYPPNRLAILGKQHHNLSATDKIGIIADAGAMAISGRGTAAGLLTFLSELQDETNFFVWQEIIKQLRNLRSVFAETSPDIDELIRKFMLKLISPAVERAGWIPTPGEDYQTSGLRALLLSAAGSVSHEGVIAESKRRFTAYFNEGDKSAIPPNLRAGIFGTCVANGGVDEFDAILTEYRTTSAVDGREICLISLGKTGSAELIKRLLEFMVSDEVKTQDKRTPAESLSNNPVARHQLWHFIRDNWSTIRQQLGSGLIFVLERFLKFTLNKFSDEETLNDIENFFKDKDVTGYDRGLEVLKDAIRVNVGWVKRDKEALREWLRAHV